MKAFAVRFLLETTVFICGAVVMVYEIVGSRIVAPFIGTSTYIWTSLIGVILGALSLGYWFGGRMADREPSVRVLAAVISLAGGLISVTSIIKDVVLSFIAGSQVPLEVKALIAAVLLFAPASVALGFVTPYAVKLEMASLSDSGKTVGRLFACSTIGSIVGTFAAGFFLNPFVGSSRTLYIISGTLIILGILLVPFSLSSKTIAIIIVFCLSIAVNEFNIAELRASNGLHDIDTEYSRVRVFETVDQKNGRAVTALATDPYFTQSAIYHDSDEAVLDYSRFYHLAEYYDPNIQNALMIGGAGYTFPREFLRIHPAARIDVVEIDPKMTAIARQFFRLTDDPRMTIIHEDGRAFLNRAREKQYDVVYMDAFNSLFSVPYHLTTIEAVRHIDRILKDDGVVIFNLGSALTGPASHYLQAEYRTYAEIFPTVEVYKVNLSYTDDRLQNLIVLAAKAGPHGSFESAQATDLLSHRYNSPISLDLPILTDDLAPVEHYGSEALEQYRR